MEPQIRFKEFITKKNLRMTPERKIVLAAVMEVNNHFTVSELLQHLEESGNKISRATVYRIMPHLVHSRIIKKAPVCGGNEEQVFERIFGHKHHDHLICEYCDEVVEFYENDIEQLQGKIAERFGFKLKSHFLELWGICPQCQEKIIERELYS